MSTQRHCWGEDCGCIVMGRMGCGSIPTDAQYEAPKCRPLNWGFSWKFSHTWLYGRGCVSGGYWDSWYIDERGFQGKGVLLIAWLVDIFWLSLLVVSRELTSEDYSYRSGIAPRIRAKYMEISFSGTLLRGSHVSSYLRPQFNSNSCCSSSLKRWCWTPWISQVVQIESLFWISTAVVETDGISGALVDQEASEILSVKTLATSSLSWMTTVFRSCVNPRQGPSTASSSFGILIPQSYTSIIT